MESYSDWLLHYGIPGMKWGVMHGPPYPLTRSQMSKEERKNAKSMAKQINREFKDAQNREYWKAADKAERINYKSDKIYKKATKLAEKLKSEDDEAKKAKYIDKIRKLKDKDVKINSKIDYETVVKGDGKVASIIEKYKDTPFIDIVGERRTVSVDRGKSFAISTLSGLAAFGALAAGAPFAVYSVPDYKVEGVDKYKAYVHKKPKKGD